MIRQIYLLYNYFFSGIFIICTNNYLVRKYNLLIESFMFLSVCNSHHVRQQPQVKEGSFFAAAAYIC